MSLNFGNILVEVSYLRNDRFFVWDSIVPKTKYLFVTCEVFFSHILQIPCHLFYEQLFTCVCWYRIRLFCFHLEYSLFLHNFLYSISSVTWCIVLFYCFTALNNLIKGPYCFPLPNLMVFRIKYLALVKTCENNYY